jgi:hypothetical protein
MKRVALRLAIGLALAALAAVTLMVPPRADAQIVPQRGDDRFAGLQWRFVRVRYHFRNDQAFLRTYGQPWYIDAPAAEENLSRRVKSATAIQVEDPIVLPLDDPKLFDYPWIYFVEGSNLQLLDSEVPILREFLLRGGTATFDDFHGPYEWAHVAQELKRVFPNRPIVDLTPPHPIFSSFYKIDRYPQVAGLGSFLAGRSWEKGGYVAHLRAILDDSGRPMVLINWNTDMGDGWEWSNAMEFPGYIKYTTMAYQMEINEIVYVLTH